MIIAVLSGKGGTGKTLISVNLAAAADRAAYVDCDVEEPNGRLFFRPDRLEEITVTTRLPDFDAALCTGCRKCVDFCRFNALVHIKTKPLVFPEVCHSCGGCALVCPSGAVSEIERTVGVVERGRSGQVDVISGILNLGEASAVPVIRAALRAGLVSSAPITVVDCPPGSSCSVMESVSEADYCLLVAEPTAFGLHNFRMVHQLVTLLGKPCGVILNKEDSPYPLLEDYCREHHLPIHLRIPYSRELAQITASGNIAVGKDLRLKEELTALLHRLREEGEP